MCFDGTNYVMCIDGCGYCGELCDGYCLECEFGYLPTFTVDDITSCDCFFQTPNCEPPVDDVCGYGYWNDSGECKPCAFQCDSCLGVMDLCTVCNYGYTPVDSSIPDIVNCNCPANTHYEVTEDNLNDPNLPK